MLVAWILFPVVLVALSMGCGLLLEVATGRRLPGLLLVPAGFAVIVAVAGLATSFGATARLATPLVIGMAVAGAGLTYPWTGRTLDRWALAAALGVFAVYAAPVVLSGEPTFAGYIKLDDTATWMAFTDRIMQHGHSTAGMPPSSYQTTLQIAFSTGYPMAAFVPLGVGHQVVGSDLAWLVQPYMATMGALLSLVLAWLLRGLLESDPVRGLVAFVAAQPALLYAYSLWGGIKEMVVAVLIAILAATARLAAEPDAGWRGVLPAALACTALLGAVGAGAAVWVLPILGVVAVVLLVTQGLTVFLRRVAPFLVVVVALAVPALFATGATFSPTESGLTSANELGNLIKPLSVFQYVGIWPVGDFRYHPHDGAITTLLIALAFIAAAGAVYFAYRRKAWDLLLYAGAATVGCIFVFVYSSPWVGAKALASGAPALLVLALAGAAVLAVRYHRILGVTVLGLLCAGVLWSNALGYHDVSLAPYSQLAELEKIGKDISGQGPTLMTEYSAYGDRHFLRDADPEGVSELRYRLIPLRDGSQVEKGAWADTDALRFPDLLVYRTLVLRRSPSQSRPPSIYRRVYSGRYYDVWQRPATADGSGIVEHLPLGDFNDPAAVPRCSDVLRLAAEAGPGGQLATVYRPPVISAPLTNFTRPASWVSTGPGSVAVFPGSGEARQSITVPSTRRYDIYVLGSVPRRLTLFVDGREVGSVDRMLNASDMWLEMGKAHLDAGPHTFALRYSGQDLGPGSGAPPWSIGPLALTAGPGAPRVSFVPADRARTLCGKRLDWIEAIRG